MEVSGRISVDPSEDWLNLRLKSVSTDDLKKELGRVKGDQRKLLRSPSGLTMLLCQ